MTVLENINNILELEELKQLEELEELEELKEMSEEDIANLFTKNTATSCAGTIRTVDEDFNLRYINGRQRDYSIIKCYLKLGFEPCFFNKNNVLYLIKEKDGKNYVTNAFSTITKDIFNKKFSNICKLEDYPDAYNYNKNLKKIVGSLPAGRYLKDYYKELKIYRGPINE